MTGSVVVEVKSAWASKINWTQAIAVMAMVLALFGIDLDGETQAYAVGGIAAVQALITWYLRTFATKTITPAAAAK